MGRAARPCAPAIRCRRPAFRENRRRRRRITRPVFHRDRASDFRSAPRASAQASGYGKVERVGSRKRDPCTRRGRARARTSPAARELPEKPQRGATQARRFRRLDGKSWPSVPSPGPNTTTGSPHSCPGEDLITPERQGLCSLGGGMWRIPQNEAQLWLNI
jgi:hypothetical protein